MQSTNASRADWIASTSPGIEQIARVSMWLKAESSRSLHRARRRPTFAGSRLLLSAAALQASTHRP
jgi:hypothetical protein